MFDAILIAQQQAGQEVPWYAGPLPMFLMLGVLFYFMLIRPMRKQEQNRKSMVSTLKKNVRVLTSSGIIGNILRIKDDDEIVLLKLDEGKISVLKSSIQKVIADSDAKESAGDEQ